MKVVFILGSGHCGSTLLDLILDSHNKIIGTGELCALKGFYSKSKFWNAIVAGDYVPELDIYRSKKAFLLNKNEYRNSYNDKKIDKKEYIKFHEKLYAKLLSETNSLVIVDSSKNIDRVQLLSESKIIEPVIIHIVRDGCGVFWSYKRKYRDKVLFCVFKWPLSNLKIEILRTRNKNIPYFYISYEKFVNNPKDILENILESLNLKFSDNVLKYRNFEHNQIRGNRMKNHKTSSIKEDLSWKVELPLYYKIILFVLYTPLIFIYNKRNFRL